MCSLVKITFDACLFNKQYPGSKTTVYKIRKLYAKHMIRKKVIRFGKVPPETSLMDIVMDAAEMSQSIQLALEKKVRICFLDEFVITKKTWSTHAWT